MAATLLRPFELAQPAVLGDARAFNTPHLQWFRDLRTAVNATGTVIFGIQSFGATGDGDTNDTAAIQAAIDALPEAGGIIYAPPGTYVVTDTISWSGLKAVQLIGAGMNATIFKWQGGASKAVFHAISTVAALPLGDVFSNFAISNPLLTASVTGIQIGSLTENNRNLGTIERVQSFNLSPHIGLYSGLDGFRISQCDFWLGTTGILANSSAGGSLSGCIIEDCTFASVGGWPIDLTVLGGSSSVRNNVILGTAAAPNGLRADRFDSFSVSGNSFRLTNSAGTAIYLGLSAIGGANLSGALVSANQINMASAAAGSRAIVVDFAQGVSLLNNTFAHVETAITITANASGVFICQQSWGTAVTTKLTNAGAGVVWFDGANVILVNLPASAAGLPTGGLWHDAGAANVVKWVP